MDNNRLILNNMEIGSIYIDLDKLVYSLIDYFEESTNPIATIYKMINGMELTSLNKAKSMVNCRLSTKVIENAWDGNGAKDLAFLAVLVHYYKQRIAFGNKKMLVTYDDIEQQARKIRQEYGSDNSRISEIVNEAIENFKKRYNKKGTKK